ncbi:MAG TPA: DUF2270 domain-containing protein [Aurantimonas coralicida]|uniref:DUF2270 domain-containing protein n=2 Tax=root TaxID=1 RepID=A0A9C9NIZ2_9HYPH|nr:DUF2270 domain-containing protein [Aurantimonas coralicida]HEU02339.1 DUF2270 domain-containing protein [Aurantimonas coralicida]
MDSVREPAAARDFSNSEMGALAHLYRGEIYRSTIWRTRLDTTTNWAVVTLGIALSIAFSSPNASPLPLVLVGILILFFLLLEARRYRYFNVWRARARWMENNLYAPMLKDGNLHAENGWTKVLADNYLHPVYHISQMTAIGRRIRRNYLWILLIQTAAYIGKLLVHPTAVGSLTEFIERADIGPFPGEAVLAIGVFYVASWMTIAIWIARSDAAKFRSRGSSSSSMG